MWMKHTKPMWPDGQRTQLASMSKAERGRCQKHHAAKIRRKKIDERRKIQLAAAALLFFLSSILRFGGPISSIHYL
jgi:hypothetical protein